jgi:hypothetical protein
MPPQAPPTNRETAPAYWNVDILWLLLATGEQTGGRYALMEELCPRGSPFDLSEEMARRRMGRAGVVLTATITLMAELAQDWSSPEGEQLKATLFGEVLAGIV